MEKYLEDTRLTWASKGLASFMRSSKKHSWTIDALNNCVLDDPEFTIDALRELKKFGYIREIEPEVYSLEEIRYISGN